MVPHLFIFISIDIRMIFSPQFSIIVVIAQLIIIVFHTSMLVTNGCVFE